MATRMLRNPKLCPGCGAPIRRTSVRCEACWKGLPSRCVDCGTPITYGHARCKPCAGRQLQGHAHDDMSYRYWPVELLPASVEDAHAALYAQFTAHLAGGDWETEAWDTAHRDWQRSQMAATMRGGALTRSA